MELEINLSNVSKFYGNQESAVQQIAGLLIKNGRSNDQPSGKYAVKEISLQLKSGDRLGIIGRNGAGKSTLLHMIAGLTEPTSGNIEIKGKVTAVMTLGTGLREEATGRENIYVDGQLQGRTDEEIEAYIDSMIDFSELGKFIDYPIKTYSTGMKSRLAFAMITHLNPEILIIDEALSAGDAFFAVKATAKIKELCSRGKIVIIVSHGMSSIKDMCNRCIYMQDGRIIADGLPEEITTRYLEDVQKEDESILIKKFHSFIKNISYEKSTEINNIELITNDLTQHSLIAQALKKFQIKVYAQFKSLTPHSKIAIKIVRLDDVVVFYRDFFAAEYAQQNTISFALIFEELLLAANLYRLEVSLLDMNYSRKTPLASSSIIFDVYNPKPPKGGRPMIYYPVAVNITRV